MKKFFVLGPLLAVLLAPSARAEVRLASPFTSHMVLQCGRIVPVWGTADPGEKVTVEFAGQQRSVIADTNRCNSTTFWSARSGSPPASQTWIFPCPKR